jgi:hypothetical protein
MLHEAGNVAEGLPAFALFIILHIYSSVYNDIDSALKIRNIFDFRIDHREILEYRLRDSQLEKLLDLYVHISCLGFAEEWV